jgi:hypothetical protein
MQIDRMSPNPKLCGWAALTLILLCEDGFTQSLAPAERQVIRSESYSQLLDTLLPRKYTPSPQLDCLMILRFEPNEGAESQLAIRAWHDGHVEATLYTVQGASVWSTANGYIARTGAENLEAIAKSIKVQSRRLDLPRPAVDKWISSLFEALRNSASSLEKLALQYRKTGNRLTELDGDHYDFWYVQGEAESHWEFSDVPVRAARREAILPLAKWMDMVRTESGAGR